MAVEPVLYRIASTVPGIVESAPLQAEQLEEIPYPFGASGGSSGDNWPPAGFTEVTPMASSDGMSSGISLLPEAFDLAWIQGDTASFQFLFTDVLWTVEDPSEENSIYSNDPRLITAKQIVENVATVATDTDHGYQVGYSVDISGLGAPFDGTFTITSVPAPNSFQYECEGEDMSSDVESGSVVITNMPLWAATEFAAQVRNPYIHSTYAADYWVPAYGYQYKWWRGHSVVAEFDCVADIVIVPDVTPTQWATRISLTLPASRSSAILPGNWYRWDLQSRTIEDEVKTHLRGRVNVVTEWTVR